MPMPKGIGFWVFTISCNSLLFLLGGAPIVGLSDETAPPENKICAVVGSLILFGIPLWLLHRWIRRGYEARSEADRKRRDILQ